MLIERSFIFEISNAQTHSELSNLGRIQYFDSMPVYSRYFPLVHDIAVGYATIIRDMQLFVLSFRENHPKGSNSFIKFV
jgi:hypothetical protein